ncbi:hypothetical protein MAR_031445 [Mya arenaria]|uniref:Uncharacterized protein n=1 Tax=Mya arenaria TaxID=6604 RepID=A0ABY7F7S6_MYAAR|nr:hypothetical protein MAR_031445 [Mya arenaria]
MMPCKMFTFTVLFILVRVVCTQECSTCQCCADGYHPKCSSRGYCNNGCIDGESKCEQSNGYCLSCVPGYWGNKCEQSCRHHCLACNKSSGECISCKHGYWRHLCTACGSRCKVCNQINGCSDVGNTSEKQTTLTAALGGGLGGGFMALIILAIIAMLWFHNRRRSNTEHNDLRHNDSLHEAQGDYTTVDANLRGVELNDLRYETLKGTDVHTMDQTTDYSNVSEKVNDNNTYQNVLGGSLSD